MSAMFGHHLRNCYLFADTGEPFLRQVTGVLEYTIYFQGKEFQHFVIPKEYLHLHYGMQCRCIFVRKTFKLYNALSSILK